MSIRLKCVQCQTAFLTPDESAGRSVNCPKCSASQVVSTVPRSPIGSSKSQGPSPASTSAPTIGGQARDLSEASVFVPADRPRSRRGRWIALGFLVVLMAIGTAGVIGWPAIQRWWHPLPTDPAEIAATRYLKALTDNDQETIKRLGTVDEPPAIRSFHSVERDRARDQEMKGSFAPIASLHAEINRKYSEIPDSEHLQPKNALGPAADTLDAVEEAKAQMEQSGLYKKMASGDPEEIFDAAEGLGKALTKLAEGPLSGKKLLPTYKQLVERAKPPLSTPQKKLALDFGEHREAWQALLKRPYLTLKADGPFILERAEARALVNDRLGSLGDPPTPLRLQLVRFRLEGIDTGWKVVAARREIPGEPPAVEDGPAKSPGDLQSPPGEPPVLKDGPAKPPGELQSPP